MAEEVKKYEPNEMSGLFWGSNSKNEKAPKYTSTFLLDQDYPRGAKIKVAVWERPSKVGNGKTFLSYKVSEDNWVKPNQNEQQEVEPTASKQSTSDPVDDDLPF